MKRRVISHYEYETHYGASLTLRPGLNLVDQELFDDLRRTNVRFRQVVELRKVEDGGRQVDWIKELVVKTPKAVTSEDVATLTTEDAKELVRLLKKDVGALRVLAGLAERGGVRGAFSAALAGEG